MKVLFLCSSNSGSVSPFVAEQVRALEKAGVSAVFFLLEGKGIKGYLKNLRKLKQVVSVEKPDILHAHYGLCGTLAVLQNKVPVIVTYHGSDINLSKARLFSLPALWFSKKNIFVSQELLQNSGSKGVVIPCGIDRKVFFPSDKLEARKRMGLLPEKKYVLFSSAFNNPVKNSPLAKAAVKLMKSDVELLEMKGYSREEVASLFNAVDVALLTSFSEGSPQFVKEALACNCPVVTTDVGDVRELLGAVSGCFITSFIPAEIAEKLDQCLSRNTRVDAQQQIDRYDNLQISVEILNVYRNIL